MSAFELAERVSATFDPVIVPFIVLGMAWVFSLADMYRVRKKAGEEPQ